VRLSLPTKLPVPIRLLKERYFGEASRNPWVARNKLASLIARLPPEVAAIVGDAVPALIAYQDSLCRQPARSGDLRRPCPPHAEADAL